MFAKRNKNLVDLEKTVDTVLTEIFWGNEKHGLKHVLAPKSRQMLDDKNIIRLVVRQGDKET